MTKNEELAYERGRLQAHRETLGRLLRELGGKERDAHSWRLERADAVAALQSLCEDFGDNDWSPDLHLADVVNKHLGNHLHDRPGSVNVIEAIAELARASSGERLEALRDALRIMRGA